MCFRTIAATKNVILAADKIGKAKTATQLTGLTFYLPFEAVTQLNEIAGKVFFYIGFVCLMIATVLTVVSALNYIIKNRAVLKEDKAE